MKKLIVLAVIAAMFVVACGEGKNRSQHEKTPEVKEKAQPSYIPTAEERKLAENIIFILPNLTKEKLDNLLLNIHALDIEHLPAYSHIHYIIPDWYEVDSVLLQKASLLERKVSWYPVSMPEGFTGIYTQDLFESIGVSDDGRMRMVVPGFLFEDFYQGERADPISQFLYRITQKHSRFSLKPMKKDMSIEFGNLQLHHLPSGELSLFIGSEEAQKIKAMRGLDISTSTIPILKEIVSYFGVSRAIAMPDNDSIKVPKSLIEWEKELIKRHYAPVKGVAQGQFIKGYQFFNDYHLDASFQMIWNGKKTIPVVSSAYEHERYIPRFVLEYFFGNSTEEIIRYMKQKEDRLTSFLTDSLGYEEIIKVPFITPSSNFVNFLTYQDRETGKSVVILPHYKDRTLNLASMYKYIEKKFIYAGMEIRWKKTTEIDQYYLSRDRRSKCREGKIHCRSHVAN